MGGGQRLGSKGGGKGSEERGGGPSLGGGQPYSQANQQCSRVRRPSVLRASGRACALRPVEAGGVYRAKKQ